MQDQLTGLIIFNTLAKSMDALYPDWTGKIIGASSFGEKKKTRRYQGVVTRIRSVAYPGFIRVRCGARQLYFYMQSFYLDITETFLTILTSIIAYRRCQQNFISDQRIQCPLICDKRWTNMIKETNWFNKHLVAFREEKKPACMSEDSPRIILLVTNPCSGTACCCATKITR